MPHRSRRRIHASRYGFQREATESSSERDSDSSMETEMKQHMMDETDSDFMSRLDIESIKDLFALCQEKCGSRLLSSLIYMIMRFANHTWRSIDELLNLIGGQRCEASHRSAETFLSGGLEMVSTDGRGGKRHEPLYEIFPELEIEGRAFAITRCGEKSCSFKVSDLVDFIDQRFYALTDTKKMDDRPIRSETSCRLDIRRWGGLFEKNSQRPYFQGHERADVIEHRSKFTSYFINRLDHYYTVSSGDQPTWCHPSKKPCVVLCESIEFTRRCSINMINSNQSLDHDESTFRSGEVSARRWIFGSEAPFFNKGRGQSHMISDFIVAHPTGPFFCLSKTEFDCAAKKYPDLLSDTDLSFIPYSATAGINVGQGRYFDSDTILSQFERLFKLLSFKNDYNNHDIEIVVDNARTHSAREYSINDFGKGIGTRCPIDFIEYLDDSGKSIKISCFFSSGEHEGKSKGLFILAKELNIPISNSIKLADLREIVGKHVAFQQVSLSSLFLNKIRQKIFILRSRNWKN